jgi:hypothetical protein
MKIGDYVYYSMRIDNYTYQTVPAVILRVNKKTLKIKGDFIEGDRIVNVSKKKCELQTK